MNRLWVRLTLAFALVILLAVGAVALRIKRAADRGFRQYITSSGMLAFSDGVRELIDYYQQEGSWEGVDRLLAERVSIGRSVEAPRQDGRAFPRLRKGHFDVVLADARGRVVFSTDGKTGRRLRVQERAKAMTLITPDEGEVIGYLLIAMPRPQRLGFLEQRFLARLQDALLIVAAVAVGLGLIAAALFSRSLTAPLQRLAMAARAVADRDFSRRVKVEGSIELAEVAQAFNEMAAALEEAERQRRNLVADVAHELRTPLSVLQGNLRAILDDVYPLDKAEISRLYDETRLLARLVDDLRELALADAGQLRLHLQPTDAAQVIHSTVENLALAAEAQGVALAARLPDDLPLVQADPDRLAQVLRNLLVNALRHTPPGGEVTVTAALLDDAVEVAVADTGEGIAPEDLPHVFDRFWRADRSRARWTGGTGLGLSVAQSLTAAQGGRLWAESAPGVGSVFRFTLPLEGGHQTLSQRTA